MTRVGHFLLLANVLRVPHQAASIFSVAMGEKVSKKSTMPPVEQILPGREEKMINQVSKTHAVNGNPTVPPFPSEMEMVMFGMGCFWGAERKFWQQAGVFSTQVGYSGGKTPNPLYKETCSGMTGHAEVVRVVFDPTKTNFNNLLKVFWESHNPTQSNRQGNDVGTQYRSAIYTYSNEQLMQAQASRDTFQKGLSAKGLGIITTEIVPAGEFYYAEDYHQQYLHKNPGGYCGLKGTGVVCTI